MNLRALIIIVAIPERHTNTTETLLIILYTYSIILLYMTIYYIIFIDYTIHVDMYFSI